MLPNEDNLENVSLEEARGAEQTTKNDRLFHSANLMPLLTAEEYLEIEQSAEFKSEYLNGQMFGMAGASSATSTSR